jgi:hypothetical protein
MKDELRAIRVWWVVSIASAALGISVLAVFLPARGESSIEGVSFTLGFLGLPSTLLASLILVNIPL